MSLFGYGNESYRGHTLMKKLISHDGVAYWRVEIVSIGVKNSLPLLFVEHETATATLAKTTQDARVMVDSLIVNATGDPAESIPIKHLAGQQEPTDLMNFKSSTGKRICCDAHWSRVMTEAMAGKVSPLIFSILLMRRFTKEAIDGGTLVDYRKRSDPFTINMLLDSYAPVCCWLGDDVVSTIMADSDPSKIIAGLVEKLTG